MKSSWCHDDVIKWKHFPRYWPFVRGIHRSPVNSPHKGQWRGALMFCLICAWINGWVNNGEAGDWRRHHAHYNVIVMARFGFRLFESHWNLTGSSAQRCWDACQISERNSEIWLENVRDFCDGFSLTFVTGLHRPTITHHAMAQNMVIFQDICNKIIVLWLKYTKSIFIHYIGLHGHNDHDLGGYGFAPICSGPWGYIGTTWDVNKSCS